MANVISINIKNKQALITKNIGAMITIDEF